MSPIAKEIKCIQGTERWWRLRAGNITASKFETVINGSEKALNTLLQEIRSPAPFTGPMNVPSLNWGRKYEPRARAEYEMLRTARVRSAGVFQHVDLFVSASPDGIVDPVYTRSGREVFQTAPLYGVEIKCPYNPDVHLETLSGGMPLKHMAQVQGNMWLTGAPFWDFISYDPRLKDPGARIFIQRIHRDSRYIDKLEERVRVFHEVLTKSESSAVYLPKKNAAATLMSKKKIDLF